MHEVHHNCNFNPNMSFSMSTLNTEDANHTPRGTDSTLFA